MSYAPIYSKLHELEERLVSVEKVPKTDVGASGLTPDNVDSAAGILEELNKFKINFTNLLNECNPLSNQIAKLSSTIATLATKEEIATFATKAELPDVSEFATKAELPDVSEFATKAELPDVSEFATKAELPDVSGIAILSEKFDNLINVVSQLNIKINEANEKIAALESA